MFTNAQVLPMKKMTLFWAILIYNFLLKCENFLASYTGNVLSIKYIFLS